MGLHATPLQLVYYLFEYFVAHVGRLVFALVPRSPGEEENVEGKVIVITGANSGLGKHTAEEMAKRGAKVIMGCRNIQNGDEAKNEIIRNSGSNSIECFFLDLADMASIRKFVATVTEKHPTVDVLINNAGISLNAPERQLTKDGFEMHMGTNHLGHFLLTNLLLESIKKSSISRVVTVSSTACVMSNLDLDDLMMEKAENLGLGNTMPYNNSKFANALFTKELAKRHNSIKSYTICPGLARTEIFRHYSEGVQRIIRALQIFGIPIEKAADTILLCGLGKNVTQDSGKFFRFGKLFPQIESLFSDEMAEKLWQISERLVNLN